MDKMTTISSQFILDMAEWIEDQVDRREDVNVGINFTTKEITLLDRVDDIAISTRPFSYFEE